MRITSGYAGIAPASLYVGAGLALAALGSCTAVIAISATFWTSEPAAAGDVAPAVVPSTPTAAEFATIFVETTNTEAVLQDDATRVSSPDCVQASPGHYMCSYASSRPGRARACHVMQAEWTPEAASSFRVTLAGRAARCGSLRQALRSLR